MHRLLRFLVAIAASGAPCDAWGQSPADTLPVRVIDSAYAAFNRHDPAAFLSHFADTWWYSVLEDTAAAPRRNVRGDELKAYRELDAFRTGPRSGCFAASWQVPMSSTCRAGAGIASCDWTYRGAQWQDRPRVGVGAPPVGSLVGSRCSAAA